MKDSAIIFKKISGTEGKSIVLFSVLFGFVGKRKHGARREKTIGPAKQRGYEGDGGRIAWMSAELLIVLQPGHILPFIDFPDPAH